MPRKFQIPSNVTEIQATFDASYPGWQEIVAVIDRPTYDEPSHQAFKYQHREEIAARKKIVTWCEVTGEPREFLTADAGPDGSFRGLTCRRCRLRLASIPAHLISEMSRFWINYCPAQCWRTYPFVCEKHWELSRWWQQAAEYATRPPTSR